VEDSGSIQEEQEEGEEEEVNPEQVAEDAEKVLLKFIRQADYYHVLQRELGFVYSDRYVLSRSESIPKHPPPTEHAPDDKLSFSSLLSAFRKAYIPLSKIQVLALVLRMYESTTHQSLRIVVGSNLLHREVVREYLVRMRLRSQQSRVPSTLPEGKRRKGVKQKKLKKRKRRGSVRKEEEEEEQSVQETSSLHSSSSSSFSYKPLSHKKWDSLKRKDLRNQEKSVKEAWRHMLAGTLPSSSSTTLSLPQIHELIETYAILPEEVLQREVANQVTVWALDMDGRRECRRRCFKLLRRSEEDLDFFESELRESASLSSLSIEEEIQSMGLGNKKEEEEEEGEESYGQDDDFEQEEEGGGREDKEEEAPLTPEQQRRVRVRNLVLLEKSKELLQTEEQDCAITKRLFELFMRAMAESGRAPLRFVDWVRMRQDCQTAQIAEEKRRKREKKVAQQLYAVKGY
jgi:hypothetical protein